MNLYTCKNYFPNFFIIIVTLIPVAIGVYCVLNYKNPFVQNKTSLLRTAILFLVIGMMFFLIYLCSYFSNYKNIYQKIKTGEVKTVEGVVSNLSTSDFLENRYDTFDIEGVEFSISSNALTPGYNRIAAHGGIINREGMYVKIKYVEYKYERFIVVINIPQNTNQKTGDGSLS